MFVVAAILSNRMPRMRNSVRCRQLLHRHLLTCYFREAYIKEYRRRTGGKNQGVVRCPCQTPKRLLGPGYHLYGDYRIPNSG